MFSPDSITFQLDNLVMELNSLDEICSSKI
jgi:hypothetical protein